MGIKSARKTTVVAAPPGFESIETTDNIVESHQFAFALAYAPHKVTAESHTGSIGGDSLVVSLDDVGAGKTH